MRRKRMAAAIISLAVVLSFVTSAFAVVDTYNNWRGFGIFEQGDSGGKVRAIQNVTKYYLGKGSSYTVDGDFGSNTKSAVKEYQESRNLVADGIVGPETWQSMRSELVDTTPDSIAYFDQFYLKKRSGGTTVTVYFRVTSRSTEELVNPPWFWETYKAAPGSTPGQWYTVDNG